MKQKDHPNFYQYAKYFYNGMLFKTWCSLNGENYNRIKNIIIYNRKKHNKEVTIDEAIKIHNNWEKRMEYYKQKRENATPKKPVGTPPSLFYHGQPLRKWCIENHIPPKRIYHLLKKNKITLAGDIKKQLDELEKDKRFENLLNKTLSGSNKRLKKIIIKNYK